MQACIDQALRSDHVVRLQASDLHNPAECRVVCNMFLLPKPNNQPRPVFDGTVANVFFSKEPFIMPALEDALNDGFEYCGKVDLTQSFLHLMMTKEL